jgi:endonuclease YncB( thermonuclease family)
MRNPVALVSICLVGCTPLEERVELYGDGWCAPPRTETAHCVLDGDTFDLNDCEADLDSDADFERVRLLGIQAPEVAHGDEPAECYGEEATEQLKRILIGRTLRLEFDAECTGVFGRTLAWVFVQGEEDDPLRTDLDALGGLGVQEDGTFDVLVNEWMVRAGYAGLYENEGESRYQDRLYEAERQAALGGLGLWGVCEES